MARKYTALFYSAPSFQAQTYLANPSIMVHETRSYRKKIIGIQALAYGASGVDGKKALNQVVEKLAIGWSTFINPDDPKGPVKTLKNGVLLMSLKTGTPIIPVSFQVSGNWRSNSWDKKRFPPFFSTFKVIYGEPVIVTNENFNQLKQQIAKEMNEKVMTKKGITTLPYI